MKITSLLTKRFALLIFIILLSTSVLAEKILILGDSHYAGTYGQTLDKSLKPAGYIVESYGCVGATAQHYIDGGKHCIKPQQGSTHNSIQEDYYLKPINDYLTSIKPDTVIISLGGNIEAVSTLKFVREKQISDIVKLITNKNIKCIWVGPPGKEDLDKSKERDIFYDQLKEALGNSCTLIDSRTYAQLKISDTSGHFPIGDQRAKNWAQSVFKDFQSIQGSITPGKASASSSIPSPIPSSTSPTSTKIIQSTCTNQQSCKEIDEVWASRIGAFVNPDLSNKVYAVPGGWVPFEQLYAQPKPVIATVDVYVPSTTTKQSVKLTEEQKSFVKTHAAQEGVDEKLALAIINAESAGNIKAISPTGCSGLMQICGGSSPKDIIQVQCTQKKSLGETQCDKDSCHVATGGFNWCNVCSDGKNCAPDDRFNVEKNIQSGIRIIKGKLQSTTGCKAGTDATKCAIAAYNIGLSPIKAAANLAGSNPSWEDVNAKLTIDLVRSHGYSSWSDSQIQSKINQLNPYVQKIYANTQN